MESAFPVLNRLFLFKRNLHGSSGTHAVSKHDCRGNILIGFTGVRSELHSRLVKIVEDIGWNLDLTRKALSLSIAEQQIVELLRGMMRNAKVLILDEPTSH